MYIRNNYGDHYYNSYYDARVKTFELAFISLASYMYHFYINGREAYRGEWTSRYKKDIYYGEIYEIASGI